MVDTWYNKWAKEHTAEAIQNKLMEANGMKPTTEVKPVYKLVKIRDGKYYSLNTGEGRNSACLELEYSLGKVTHAPIRLSECPTTDGIFCYTTLKKASHWLNSFNKVHRNYRAAAILECYIVQPATETDPDMPSFEVRPRAILPVREVFREETPEWHDITSEVTVVLKQSNFPYEGDHRYIAIKHNNVTIAVVTHDSQAPLKVNTSLEAEYRFIFPEGSMASFIVEHLEA